MSIQQFSRGRVTYGSGSYAPTRGQVSARGAQGYLKRELRKNTQQGVSRFGGDGASDTRSGVAAAAALARKNKGGANFDSGAQWGPQPPKQVNALPTTGGGKPGVVRPETGGGKPGVGQPGGGANGPGTPEPETPNVTIGANGQLQLPYNANWGQTVIGAMGDYNNQLIDLQTQRQQQALDFMNQNKMADDQYTTIKRDTLSNSAGAGTAFSSGYGLAVGNNANAYNTFKNNLATQNTMANNNFDLQQSNIVANFNDILRQGALDLADETAQNAGSLGFGTIGAPGAGSGGGNNTPYLPTDGKGDDIRYPKPPKPTKPGKGKGDDKKTDKYQQAAKNKMKRGRNAS